ncbi:MAG: hypothetical protein M1821_005485 [Bathelium mastoideum]|nr:MAG: hypothetical protein M1821_005485 [Bathelium mastoideum]
MDLADDDSSSLSELSSVLSPVPSRSPTPPSDMYPSPPPTQQSSVGGTPTPEDKKSDVADGDGPPPAKRRRMDHDKPRITHHLDLSLDAEPAVSKEQIGKLLKVLHKKRKIVVVAGAGISVAAGIPDFRSSTGLFSTLKSEHNLKGSGKHLFDASVYKDDVSTSTFHEMVRKMSSQTKAAQPTEFHHLLASLAHEGRLLRLYSQNVDGLDTRLEPLKTEVPLPRKGPWPRTIQLHGGLDMMVCSKCHRPRDFEKDLFDGPIPPACRECAETDRVRTDHAGKRSHGIGRMRPRMVLYNEHNPDDEAIGSVTQADLRKRPDALIVVGTTLKVPGVKRIVREMAKTVRGRRDGISIWINNDPEPTGKEFENCWDLIVRGRSDEVARLAAMRHWDDKSSPDREVTDEEWQIRGGSQPEVVVESPHKHLIQPNPSFKPHLALDTPVSTPQRPQPELLSPAPCPSLKLSNPASKGRTINDALKKSGQGAKPKAPGKKRGPKKESKAPDGKISIRFKQTKPMAIKNEDTKSEQLNAKDKPKLPGRPPNKSSAAALQTNAHSLLHDVPPQSVRNNACPPHKPPKIDAELANVKTSGVIPLSPVTTSPSSLTPPTSPSELQKRRREGTISPKGTIPKDMLLLGIVDVEDAPPL